MSTKETSITLPRVGDAPWIGRGANDWMSADIESIYREGGVLCVEFTKRPNPTASSATLDVFLRRWQPAPVKP